MHIYLPWFDNPEALSTTVHTVINTSNMGGGGGGSRNNRHKKVIQPNTTIQYV